MKTLSHLFSLLCLVAATLIGSNPATGRARVRPPARAAQVQAGGQAEPAIKPVQPLTCESLSAYLDDAIIDSNAAEGSYLIVIARPGSGERSNSLSRSRLENVEQYLNQRKVKYRTAVGSPVKGLGQIEIYVGGKPVTLIQIRKNSRSACEGQVNPFIGE